VGGWSQLSPLGTAATSGLLYQPQMISDGDCVETGGMKIGRGNRSTRRKPAPVPLCPPQTTHAVRTRTRAAAVGSQRLTAWTTARPSTPLKNTPILDYVQHGIFLSFLKHKCPTFSALRPPQLSYLPVMKLSPVPCYFIFLGSRHFCQLSTFKFL
jgi:hypothetical protein